MLTLKNKSVLVTGGAGFIGSHLIDRLIKENPSNIVVVDNLFLGKKENLQQAKKMFTKLKLYIKDASNFKIMAQIMKKEKVDVVFDLATIPLPASHINPMFSSKTIFDITLNCCELCRIKYFKTLIHCSSSEAYGSARYVPMDENHPLDATTPYAAAKASEDLMVLSYFKTFGIDASIVRPFNNYGPRQNDKSYAGIIPIVIRRIMNKQTPVIFGDGKQTRDFTFVTDTVEGMINIYKNPETRGEIINLGNGKETSMNELVNAMCKILGWKHPLEYTKSRPADVRRHYADIRLAKKLIKYNPKINLEEGLKQTIDWYKRNN